MPKHTWNFKAKVIKVVDGDTIKFLIDRGFRDYSEMNIRLARIDAPEKRKGELQGYASKAWLEDLLQGHEMVLLKTFKSGKYRWVCEVLLGSIHEEDSEDKIYDINVSDELVKAGHAIYKDY